MDHENKAVLQSLCTSQTNGHSVHSTNQAGMADQIENPVQAMEVDGIVMALSEMTKPSAVVMERSDSPHHNAPDNSADREMENVSHMGVDVPPIDEAMEDNNDEHNRKRKATTDTERNNSFGNLTVSLMRRNELGRNSQHGYDIPNATLMPLPI